MGKIMELPDGLEDLPTYFARHSFALDLFKKTKVSTLLPQAYTMSVPK